MRGFYSDFFNNIVTLRISIALTILIVIFLMGSTGYHVVEGMTFFDGFYMTFITITTIGFAELQNLSDTGRVLTMVLFVMGIGVISYIASQTTQLLFESELFRKRTMQKQLEKMGNHYIICGYGRIGHRIAEVLKRADIPLVIVENRDSSIERIREDGLLYVAGNAQEEEVLHAAGIERAKGLICALSRDQDNVFVTLIAREVSDELFILVRTNEHKNMKKISRAGANKVISPYEIGADRMANVILRPHVDHFIDEILGGTTQDHVFEEIRIFEGSELAGRSLSEAEIRQKYFVVIIAIIPAEGGEVVFNPGSGDRIHVGDSLIVLGDIDRIRRLKEEGCKDYRSLRERVSEHDLHNEIGTANSNSPS